MFPLSVWSFYSLMYGTSGPDVLCRHAGKLGYTGLALTDRNTLAGLWDFIDSCKRQGLKPVIGAEITSLSENEKIICLVKNTTGYHNLCNLISYRNMGADFTLIGGIGKFGRGLVILSCSSVLLKSCRGNDLDLAADLGNRPTEKGRALYRWAKKNNLPAVATSSAVFAEKKDTALFHLMQAIAKKNVFSFQGEGDGNAPACLEHPQVYEKRFAIWPEVVTATDDLAARCSFTGPEFGIVMPPWNGEGKHVAEILRQVSYEGACRRYGLDLSEDVVERLEYELQVIASMGFCSYFLVVRDIVRSAHGSNSRGSSRICGRGSGAASLVAYCLELTNVCPLKHNLYFERFLNPGRSDPPDIDIDFSWDTRDAVLDQVLRKYAGYAAMVSTCIRFQPRMAIRETARAFGLPSGEIAKVTKRLSGLHLRQGESLVSALHNLPTLQEKEFSSPWSEIFAFASRLIGVPRYLSVHPGGIVITPKPITEYVPLEYAAKGVPIMQWDKNGAEAAGLVKIDLLGNRSLGVIRDCIESIKGDGSRFDEEYWNPEEDSATAQTVAEGRTMGCFYIESPAMRLLQKKAATGEFAQLVLQSSLIRPAANDYVREYVRRLHGGKWQHLHPKLAEVLDETFGLMVYQEDVSRVAVALAGFSHARADALRKVLSKKDKVYRLRDYADEFDKGCAANGVDKAVRKKLWQMMMSFDGYSFCKAHSASYARVSFQAAYLKTHYPAEFMAAVISNQGGYYSTFAYVSEAKRLGLLFDPPCVNRSDICWQGRGKRIRVGLMAVKGLSQELLARILCCRREKLFTSSIDFWQRVSPAGDEAKSLIYAGALDGMRKDGNRMALFWELSQVRCHAKARQGIPLFTWQLPVAPDLPPLSPKEQFRREYQTLGFLCNEHPLLLCGNGLRGRTRASDLTGHKGKQIQFCGWLLSGKLVSTNSGEVMEFLTFEDETGVVETTFFPRVYRKYALLLRSGVPYMLQGVVEEEYGTITLTVERVRRV